MSAEGGNHGPQKLRDGFATFGYRYAGNRAEWSSIAHAGLVVLGVHTPEFGFEKHRANVEWAIREFRITFPVAMDNKYRIWQAFQNE